MTKTKDNVNMAEMLQQLQGLAGGLGNLAGASGVTKVEKQPWWATYGYPESPELEVHKLISFTRSALFFHVLMHEGRIYEINHGYNIKNPKNMIADLEKLKLRLVYDAENQLFFADEDTGLYLRFSDIEDISPTININCVTTNKETKDKILTCIKKYRKQI